MKLSFLVVTFLSFSLWAQNAVLKTEVKEDKFTILMKALEANKGVSKTQYSTLNILHTSLASENSVIQEQNKSLCTYRPPKRTDFVELSHQILVSEMKKLIKEIEKKVKKEQFNALQDEAELLETNQVTLLEEQARLIATCDEQTGKKEIKQENPNPIPLGKNKNNKQDKEGPKSNKN